MNTYSKVTTDEKRRSDTMSNVGTTVVGGRVGIVGTGHRARVSD